MLLVLFVFLFFIWFYCLCVKCFEVCWVLNVFMFSVVLCYVWLFVTWGGVYLIVCLCILSYLVVVTFITCLFGLVVF